MGIPRTCATAAWAKSIYWVALCTVTPSSSGTLTATWGKNSTIRRMQSVYWMTQCSVTTASSGKETSTIRWMKSISELYSVLWRYPLQGNKPDSGMAEINGRVARGTVTPLSSKIRTETNLYYQMGVVNKLKGTVNRHNILLWTKNEMGAVNYLMALLRHPLLKCWQKQIRVMKYFCKALYPTREIQHECKGINNAFDSSYCSYLRQPTVQMNYVDCDYIEGNVLPG